MSSKFYIIAGEASGDIHGAGLIRELKAQGQDVSIRCWGGDLMQQEGAELINHYKDLAFMGIWEVLKNIRTIKKNLDFCKKDILEYKPDAVILIDYPGFNLRIAEFVHQHNIPCFYYISPKVWVWKTSRVYKIKAFVDKMFVIFPFETDFYRKYQYEVSYVGNPTMEEMTAIRQKPFDEKSFRQRVGLDDRPIIALLAGSRKQEIHYCFPDMLEAVKSLQGYNIVVTAMSSIKDEYAKYSPGKNVTLVFDQVHDVLKASRAAIVTSGTAVLETALLHVPQVAVYKAGQVSFMIARAIISKKKLPYFTLPNIIMGREIVKEILQYNLPVRIKEELDKLLNNQGHVQRLEKEYQELSEIIGNKNASVEAARLMHEYIRNK